MKCDACGYIGEATGRCPMLACPGQMQAYELDGIAPRDSGEEMIIAIARGMGTEARRCTCGTLFASAEPDAASCPPCRGVLREAGQ